MRLLAVMSAVLLGLLAAGCGGGREEAREEGSTTREETAPDPRESQLDFDRVETVVEGLDVPWALAFADERTILVTERPGRVRLVQDGRLRPEPIADIDVVAEGEGGLLGIALHPDFPARRSAFVYYTAPDGNRVSRFRVGDDYRLTDEEILLDGIPASSVHGGGALAFGPDELLYAATGDAGNAEAAADRQSLGGELLRIRPDGGVPGDNPFGDSPVYSYGHRNPQGLDWDDEGNAYASEHGPTGEFGLCCHDEVNLVERGEFYGWPYRAGEARAAGGSPPQDPVDPIAESGADKTWAPAGLAVHDPEDGPTSLYVANLAGEQLLRFVLDGPRSVEEQEVALDGEGRLRAAAFGPDGCLYLTTSNTDGRGQPREGDDRLLRICPGDDRE